MMTTIQVSDISKRRLDLLKKQSGGKSYDKILQEILQELVDLESVSSLAGAFPGLTWSKKDRMKFRGE